MTDTTSFLAALGATRNLRKRELAQALLDLRETFTGIPFGQRGSAAEALRKATAALPAPLKTVRHREPSNRVDAVESVSRGENAAWVAAQLGFDNSFPDKSLTVALQGVALATSARSAIDNGGDVQDVCRRFGITHPDLVSVLQRLAIVTAHEHENSAPLLQRDMDLNERQKKETLQRIEDLGRKMAHILVRWETSTVCPVGDLLLRLRLQ